MYADSHTGFGDREGTATECDIRTEDYRRVRKVV